MCLMTKFSLVFLLLCTLLMPSAAQAGPKFFSFWWWSSHWENQDFIPYYDNGTEPHNTQWSETSWKPEDWVSMDTGRGTDLISKWVTVGVLQKQYVRCDDVPAVDVGPNFYHLSGLDKRRVMETLDYVYQVTAKRPGMFYVNDPETGKIIGSYSKTGLVLQ